MAGPWGLPQEPSRTGQRLNEGSLLLQVRSEAGHECRRTLSSKAEVNVSLVQICVLSNRNDPFAFISLLYPLVIPPL